MTKIPVSVAILTRNNAATLPRALESVKNFEEVLVCDGKSTDETLAIAKRHGARILRQDARFLDDSGALKDFSGARNQCIAAASYGWILFLDSDEYASEDLTREVAAIAATGTQAIYWVPRKYVLDGVVIERSIAYPNRQMRFFHQKAVIGFRKPVHEKVEFHQGAIISRISSPIYVPIPSDPSVARAKNERYIRIDLDRMSPLTMPVVARVVLASLKFWFLYLVRLARVSLFERGPRMPLSRDCIVFRYHYALATEAVRRFLKGI